MIEINLREESLALHEKHKGKIEIRSKIPLNTTHDLSLAYTPGVAEVCKSIVEDPNNAYKYTIKGNTIAIVTDGSAVLGLGDIGGLASLPVMEGKALLFKEFAGLDAFPICFENYHTDFIEDVINIAPVFGGINLEDIKAPKCFELEEALQDIGIPVMHDDQHGTAIVVLAGLINALKVTKKDVNNLKIVVNGAGAAGIAISNMLKRYNKEFNLVVCDSKGIISENREDINKYKKDFAVSERGNLSDALYDADVFIGVSKGKLLQKEMIKGMNKDPIIFALANPEPEIMPDLAKEAGASIVATGRSDFPNQVNNVLAFPGIFKGALDACAKRIDPEMKLAAALAIAGYVKSPTNDNIIPNALDKKVAEVVAAAVKNAALCTGMSKTDPEGTEGHCKIN